MPRARNPFSVLGVTPEDDMTIIRMAWRAKVRDLHPDRAADKANATEQLAEVNAAFDALQGHEPKAFKRPRRQKPSKPKARVQPRTTKVPRSMRKAPEKKVRQATKERPVVRSTDELVARRRALAGYAEALKVSAA